MSSALLILLIVLAMGATLFALVRGIIAFLKTTEADLNNEAIGASESGLRQNKMMMQRITFQAVAVLLVAVLLLMNSGK